MYFCKTFQTDFCKNFPNRFPQTFAKLISAKKIKRIFATFLKWFLQKFSNRFPQKISNGFPQNFTNRFPQTFPNGFLQKKFNQISAKFSKWIFNIFRWARRALLLGPKGPTVAPEGCSPPQELEKAARRQFPMHCPLSGLKLLTEWITNRGDTANPAVK